MNLRTLLIALFVSLALMPSEATQGRHDRYFEGKVKVKDQAKELIGKARFRKGKLEIKVRGRTKKFTPDQIEYFEELDPLAKPSAVEVARARKDYAKKLEYVKKDEAPSWIRIGLWCRKKGLEDEAVKAFKKAIDIDPDARDARRELGFFKVGSEWKEAKKEADKRWQAVKKDNKSALLKFATWAAKYDLPQAFEALDKVFLKDFRDKKGLKLMRPYTDKLRLKTKLQFPLRGRWYASLDRTRHHQMKAYAVYALDLMKVDENGKKYRGNAPRKLEDFYTWDEPVYAVADGVVVEARDGYEDNPINTLGGKPEKHNGVSIRHLGSEHSFYVHLKKGSVAVKVGDQVKAGQVIGTVGNSGGSNWPHLHFTMAVPSAVSVPWWCEDYKIVIEGTEVWCKSGQPREGQTIVNEGPKRPKSGGTKPGNAKK